ncbi:GntR family transcriptional regulator [Kitasatospora sp. NPDC059408]|uniref:GntR family transcriptional regulator n=1 Tax=Kitasatospora sp. NPDC059408 TaxID=3346823 RepID=UPI0036B7390A
MAKKYERIADALREEIRAGQRKPGDRLPAETALAEQYGTSVPTLRQAVGVLEAEGLVEKRHGRGTFVRKEPTKVVRDGARHQWEKDRARQPESVRITTGATERDTGLTIGDLVFEAKYAQVSASGELAKEFGVPEGTTLLRRTYRTRNREELAPLNRAESYLVLDMIAGNPDLLRDDQEPWPGGTQNQLWTVGIELDRIVETFRARPPTPEEVEDLDLSAGVSVFICRKISIDINDRVVEVSDVVLPGDRTELVFTSKLTRW